MKRVHLICNAHLDPVWLWRWQEGCTEALSTFRTAEAFTEEFPDFVFNHNEAILYEWVKENEPELFARIHGRLVFTARLQYAKRRVHYPQYIGRTPVF